MKRPRQLAFHRLYGSRLMADESGATLVELAVVLPVFLMLFLGLIDFGRMGAEYVMAEKAIQRAVRVAAVRLPACSANLPQFNLRGTVPPGTVPPRYGTLCSAGANTCASPATVTCAGNISNTTVAEIWAATSDLLPQTATPANLRFTYAYNSNLGFLGGPYVPVVTVEIQNLNFQFATPLAGLAALAGAGGSSVPAGTLPFPTMSNSLPAEDLNLGNNG